MSRTRTLMLALPPAFGVLAVLLGKDANWDLLHYHFYNPYAWLHHRFGQDLLADDFHGFFNPLLDLPFYWANNRLPAVAITFILGALHGVNAILLWLIARAALRPDGPVPPAVPALLGAFSAGAIYMLGTTYYDALVAMPVFLGLWLILRDGPQAFDGPLCRRALVFVAAGFAAGAAVGLKQTVAVFALGIAIAVPLTPGRRLTNTLAYGAGLGLGVLATSGFWLWHLWQTTGNPLFPYFNDIFRSPLATAGNNRTHHAMPHGVLEALGYPFVFTREPWRIDSPVRDLKLLTAYLMVPAGIAFAVLRRQAGNALARPRPGLFLLLAAAATYPVWLWLFSIYRYLAPIEMLAPLLIVVAAGFLPLGARARRWLLGALLLLILPIQPSNRDREPWRGTAWQSFVDARPPAGETLAGALVVVPGWHPGWRPNAFVIPFFPPDMAFVRIVAHDDPAGRLVTGFDDAIAARIASHAGPLLVLFTPGGERYVAPSLARHGLVADFAACRSVVTRPAGPYELCPVRRTPRPAAPASRP